MKSNAIIDAIGLATMAAAFAYAVDALVDDSPIADVTISVYDDSGKPVTNANAGIYFGYFRQEDGVQLQGKTDVSGAFSAQHRTNTGTLMVTVEKEGHYKFREDRFIGPSRLDRARWNAIAETRTWTPDPIRFDVVLKRIVNPKRLTLHSVNPKPFPVIGEPFGLDLETLEWCPPYGNGKHEDATLVYEAWQDPDRRLRFTRKLKVAMPNAADGFYVAKMDSLSDFPYAYRADTNAVYRKEGVLFFDRTEERIIEQNFPTDDEYFIFRARTVTNAEGRVTSAHYGRIGEKPSHMSGLKAAVWFNQDENDTNLEDGWH